jgi:hypothetical protein
MLQCRESFWADDQKVLSALTRMGLVGYNGEPSLFLFVLPSPPAQVIRCPMPVEMDGNPPSPNIIINSIDQCAMNDV